MLLHMEELRLGLNSEQSEQHLRGRLSALKQPEEVPGAALGQALHSPLVASPSPGFPEMTVLSSLL